MKKIAILSFVFAILLALSACGKTEEPKPTRLGTSAFTVVLPEGYSQKTDDMDEDQVAYFHKDDNSVDFDVYQWKKGSEYTLEAEANAYAEDYDTVAEPVTVNGINGMKYVSIEEYEGVFYTVENYMFEDDVNIVEISFWTIDSEGEHKTIKSILDTLKKN